MANSDMLVRIKANTDNYNAGIARARRTLEGFIQENLSLGGVIGQVTKSFTAYAAGIASISALAGKLSSVVSESVDLAMAGEGVRQAFERLNRPDLLDNLREATHGTVNDIELMKQAVKFENFKLSLDDMGAMLAFAQQKAKDTGESIDYMVNSITTGLGRQSKQILDNLGISAAELTQRMSEGKDMTQAVADIIREEMAKAGDYIETASDRAARATAENQNRLEELGREIMPVAETFNTAWKEIELGGLKLLNKVLVPLANSLSSLRKLWNEGKVDWNIIPKNGIPNLDNVDDNGNFIKKPKNGSGMITWSSVSNIDEVVVTGTKPKKTKKTKKSKGDSKKTLPTYDEFELRAIKNEQIIESEKEAGKLFKDMPSPYKMMFDEIKKQIIDKKDFDYGKDISTDWVVNSKGQLVNKKQGKGKDSESNFVKGIDNVNDTLSNVGGSINNIFGSLQQMGIEIPQGIASVLGALNIITSILTFIQSVVAIKSILPFANGGIVPHAAGGYMVPGNYYSGDVTPIMANAGELILNKSQQNNIASQLTQAGGGGRLVAKLRGRDILISLERELSETGKGQLATWR